MVDSCDDIIHLRVDRQDKELNTTIVATLKQQLTASQARDATSQGDQQVFRIGRNKDGVNQLHFRFADTDYWTQAGLRGEQPTEWLLFLRTDGKSWRLFFTINLTRPRETSSTAAITAEGKALTRRVDILAATNARLKLHRKIPSSCDREMIEDVSGRKLADWYDKTQQGDWFFSPSQMATVRGGFTIPIFNDYWDSPEAGDLDEDLHLTCLFVPADQVYAQMLLKRILESEHPSDRQLLALLNYPGAEAEKSLEKVIKSGSTSGLTASRLLYYLHYRRSPRHRLDTKLIGRWELRGINETVELELLQDHTCVVNTRPTKVTRHLPGYQPVEGKGYWAIRDGKLWVCRSHIQRNGNWSPARREFFESKRMLNIARDHIKLEGGPPMKRPTARQGRS